MVLFAFYVMRYITQMFSGHFSVNKDDGSEILEESPKSSVVERPVTRHKEQLAAKQDAEFFETPIENIQWDKITPEDRVKMKERYTKRELELLKKVIELQHKLSIGPLGRDRTFRRYWMFQSMPGLFVEDQDEHVPDDFFSVVPQSGGDSKTGIDEKSTSSDKENESFDLNRPSAPPTPTLPITDDVKPLMENASNKAVMLDSSLLQEQAAKSVDVFQQITQRSQIRWAFYSHDQLDTLIGSLNSRGFREGALKSALKDYKSFLVDHMKNVPLDQLILSEDDVLSERKQMKYQNVRLKKKKTQGSVQNTSAQEFLELNLREMLLDIEERIYVGSLGSVKVCYELWVTLWVLVSL